MKLSTVAMFGAGYVLGTRAGHQRGRKRSRRAPQLFDSANATLAAGVVAMATAGAVLVGGSPSSTPQ